MSLKKIWLNNAIKRKYIRSKQIIHLNNINIANKLIIFIVPDKDEVNGGILSIISLAEETAKLHTNLNASVFISTLPGDLPLYRFTKFNNSETVVDIELLLTRVSPDAQILVHIPELYVQKFSRQISSLVKAYPSVRWGFNILLQNIDFIPEKRDVDVIAQFGNITCTTAHQAYSNKATEMLLGCPVYHFSTWASPEKYIFKPYQQKSNLIVVSPDNSLERNNILGSVKRKMSGYEFRVIKNLTYEEYKELISKAKFSITFGEGLDGYFTEPIFSGGIGSAVYNDRFFTDDFSGLPFIYKTWEQFQVNFPQDAISIDNEQDYQATHLRQFDLLASKYSHDKYIQNLINFYQQGHFFS